MGLKVVAHHGGEALVIIDQQDTSAGVRGDKIGQGHGGRWLGADERICMMPEAWSQIRLMLSPAELAWHRGRPTRPRRERGGCCVASVSRRDQLVKKRFQFPRLRALGVNPWQAWQWRGQRRRASSHLVALQDGLDRLPGRV
jgi:hypothetical protein